MLHSHRWLSVLLPFAVAVAPAIAAPDDCNPEDFATDYVAAYLEARPIADAEVATATSASVEWAECQQDWAIEQLSSVLGEPIGYKVALTSTAAQEQIGSDGPIPGVLFPGAMLPNGSTIAVESGGRLIYELDLLVRVGSDEIAEAETIADVAEAIDAVIPFIEVADLMVSPGSSVTAPLVVAINAGARSGVVGEAIAIDDPQTAIEALETMQVELTNDAGEVLVEARGNDLMGHPLNAVLILLEEAERRGWNIGEGNLISLGSFGRFAPAESGLMVHAAYDGLASETAMVTASFE